VLYDFSDEQVRIEVLLFCFPIKTIGYILQKGFIRFCGLECEIYMGFN
jgi:hypothetical protein